MYAPAGHGLSEVGDIEVFPHGDELHLFHLTLPNHDLVQHAVSDDGLAWRPLPAALRTGDPGAPDDDQIWTMSVTAHDGGFVMLYTALSRADDGMVQRTALARSTDLIHWQKAGPAAVTAADPRWYEADPAVTGRVSWRDPKPIVIGETAYATVNAREGDGPLARRGCVGLLTSTDFATWEVRPPLFTPRRYWDLECPQVFTLGASPAGDADAVYLTAAIMEDRSQRYWVAPRFEGPYAVPPDGGILAPAGHYAGRVCRWRGLDLFFCWHRPALHLGWLGTVETVDWLSLRNPFGKFVVPPLVLRQRENGSLARESFPGWEAYRLAEPVAPRPLPRSLYGDRAVTDAIWRVEGHDGGMDVVAADAMGEDFLIEGELTMQAAAGGLAFRLDGEGGGYFVELRARSTAVSLQKWVLQTDPRDGHRSSRFTELQRGQLAEPISAERPLPFRLLVVGPYIECSLGGDVVIAELSAELPSGAAGIWAESGMVEAPTLIWSPMGRPLHG